MTRSFVTGATGFVGAHVARVLIDRGDEVTALVRPTSNTRLLDGLPVRMVTGDITELDSLLPHLSGTEHLYHIAADYRLWARDPREIYHSNVDGTRTVLEAARQCGVARIVYTSTVGCLGIPHDGSPGDETTPVRRRELVGHYKKSKYDAEQVALAFAEQGLDVVVVNPSTPVGPGDIKPTPTGKTIVDFLNGRMPAYVDTGLNLVAVEDVAVGHLLAAQRGKAGRKYILGNRNMTLHEILETLAGITGQSAPRLCLPHWVAIAAAAADTARSRIFGGYPQIALEAALMSQKRMFFSSARAVRELGLPQTPVENALVRAVEWFIANGYTKA